MTNTPADMKKEDGGAEIPERMIVVSAALGGHSHYRRLTTQPDAENVLGGIGVAIVRRPASKAAAEDAGQQPAPPIPTAEDYSALVDDMLDTATEAKVVADAWSKGKDLRAKILWPDDEEDRNHWQQIKTRVEKKIATLRK